MRPIETLLSLANLVAFFALAIPRLGALRWTGYSALLALLIVGAQALVEGPRWQMVPAYALSGLFFLVWLLQTLKPASRSIERRWIQRLTAILGVGSGILGLAVSIALPMAFPIFHFPHPSGPYDIGTLTYHWVDVNRPEVFTADPNDRRELMVQIWYPATGDRSTRRAPYVQDVDALAPALARLFHLPEFTFEHLKYITTHAIPSAPVAGDERSYPVLIFLEGFTGFRQMNTFQVEELVSHGYVVAAIDQPYAAAEVVFPDGRQAIGLPRDQMDPLIQQSISPVETAPSLNGRTFEDGMVPYLAQDATFTLDQLESLNQADPNGVLTGRLDLQHAGIFGVSLGGIISSEACRLEPRLRACLVMDAPMPADVVQAGLQQPAMWITRDAKTMQLEGWSQAEIDQHQTTMRAVFESLPGDGYFVRVPGMFHVNLTDFPFLIWAPLSSRLGLIGPIDAGRAHNIVNAYSLAFFDRHLKDQPAALLDGPSEQFPEVLFETRRTRGDHIREAGSSLVDTKWRLVSFGEPGAETPVREGSTITLEFDGEGEAGGAGGCNAYGAQYEVQGNVLSFGEITHTLMACESEAIGEQEQHFFQSLETAGRFGLSGDGLTLWYDDGQGALNWVK